MKQFNDDDIEVLGGESGQRRRGVSLWWFIAAAVIVAIAVIVWIFIINQPVQEAREADFDDAAMAEVSSKAVGVTASIHDLPVEFTDSINDVVFTVISLEGHKAEVTFAKPDSADCDIVVAVPAADIRADNGEIVGEFIHNRKQLSRGVRKKGFCYISPKGNITIGAGDGAVYKESALNEDGTFFRQYSLVMDGEIQPNILKGKAGRRALAILNGKPTIVISKNRESIYDFSQALADYGFSHAIYLPGGRGLLKLLTDRTDQYHSPDYGDEKYVNYLIFRR